MQFERDHGGIARQVRDDSNVREDTAGSTEPSVDEVH